MRQARDWSQTQAFEALRDGLGLGPKSRASYIRLDMGDRAPRPREMQFLVDYFGQGPDERPTVEERDPLVLAVEEQTRAIHELIAELRSTREPRRVTNEVGK